VRGINFDGVPEAPKPKRKRPVKGGYKSYVTTRQANGFLQAALREAESRIAEQFTEALGDDPWMVRMRERRENKRLLGVSALDAQLTKRDRRTKARLLAKEQK
jgi:hypothetical protein